MNERPIEWYEVIAKQVSAELRDEIVRILHENHHFNTVLIHELAKRFDAPVGYVRAWYEFNEYPRGTNIEYLEENLVQAAKEFEELVLLAFIKQEYGHEVTVLS